MSALAGTPLTANNWGVSLGVYSKPTKRLISNGGNSKGDVIATTAPVFPGQLSPTGLIDSDGIVASR
jgi:hypothetical protein